MSYVLSFELVMSESDIFFQPVKKRPHKRHPPRRHNKKFPGHPKPSNSVAPVTQFHFVEELSDIPIKTILKRFPSETSSNLNVNR